ncbi:hypothetical protein DFR72_107117 [Lentzea flaviverrucosa]|uniref:Uncharacterized protein n=1 Tax=Lentzea flaviverrucosa TaxID=200379 RepID=A0A1H9JDT3_9PSEU|nr:hypothetical protein DFR72_107117 [Lentzea flaviverrucosa]SEQ85151.1 hypothetical protein SAMN05216195_103210 [Lentzea flaviverrucosa]
MTRVLVRLRPVVQATQTSDGLHLRGWASSCTLSGGSGLWKVWQRLAPQLESGLPRASLEVPEGTAPAVRAAVTLILEQLWEHDMLVEMPSWGADVPAPEVAAWLESAAAEPVEAWRRLRGAVVVVAGHGALEDAAVRAAEAVGLAVERSKAGDRELVVSAGDLVVVAGCGTDVGYVLPPTAEGFLSVNTEVTMRTAARLGVTGEPPEVLAALIGSSAVHRVVCALAGLPDPASELATGTYPMALVAHADPLSATYHPLLQGAPPSDPWRALEALTDHELGPVDTPVFGPLPQVPANLATSGDALGIGTTADSARLNAALNALKSDGVIGIDETHARGAALRLAARHHRGEPADAHEWTSDPTAHRWWKALTSRFGIPAVVRTERLAPGIHKAEISNGQRVLAWAVEATAADAVAFAALAATGYAQAGRTGTAHLNGAAPLKPADHPDWVTRQWHWPADVRDREERLQQAIAMLPGVRIRALRLDPELRAAGLRAYR